MWALNDVYVRREYQKSISVASSHVALYVEKGVVTPLEGAKIAHAIRIMLVEAMRARSAPGGRFIAMWLKSDFEPVEFYLEKYSKKLFDGSFGTLKGNRTSIVGIVLSFLVRPEYDKRPTF
jgi:hypothetical protein